MPNDPVIESCAGGAVTRISRGPFNCYIVHDAGAGAPLVVDPGTPSNGRDAAARVADVGSVPPVVVCSHGHLDHVAGVPEACTPTGAGYLLAAPAEAFLAGDEVPLPPGPREVIKIAPVLASQPFDLAALRELAPLRNRLGHDPGGMTMPTPPVGFLADGDAVPGADGWTALLTPGHADDALCLYHEHTGVLLSGDTVLTHDGRAWINPEVVRPEQQAATEDRMRSLAVAHLLPGHGLPVAGREVTAGARSFRERPPGRSISARLSRLLGAW